MKKAGPNSLLHLVYVGTLTIKGLDGALETLAGLILAVAGPLRLYDFAFKITAPELDIHPQAAHLVRHGAERLTQASVHFIIFYLLVHGILKLGIVIALLRGKGHWIFPVACAVLGGFICFMSYHLSREWSWWVLGFALFDVFTVALVVNEWRRVPRRA